MTNKKRRDPPQSPPRRVLIDGYNLMLRLIGGGGDVAPHHFDELHRCIREGLPGIQATIFYDGKPGMVFPSDPRLKPLTVTFTSAPRSADEAIIAAAKGAIGLGIAPGHILVVTTDLKDVWSVLQRDGVRLLTSEEFWRRIRARTERLRASVPERAYVSMPRKEVEAVARFLNVHPDEVMSLNIPASRPPAKSPAAPSKSKAPSGVPPPPKAKPAGETSDVPDIWDYDAWEQVFKSAKAKARPVQPNPRSAATVMERQNLPPVKRQKGTNRHGIANHGDLPRLTDTDGWEDVFSGDDS